MRRGPALWEQQIRREVLQDELVYLRELPYSVWREITNAPFTKKVTARDGRPYRIRVSAERLPDGSEDVQVTLTLERSSWPARRVMRQTFVITPDNRFKT